MAPWRALKSARPAGQTIYGIARTFGMKPGAVHKLLTRRFGAETVQQIYRERLANRNRKIWHTYQYERPPWPVFAERFKLSVKTVKRIVRARCPGGCQHGGKHRNADSLPHIIFSPRV